MNFWKRIACGAVALSVLLFAGCSGEDKTWAYRSGDETLPVGVYIYYMIQTGSEAEAALWEEHQDEEDFEMPKKYKQLLKETVNGEDAPGYISRGAERKVREFYAIEQEFERRGLALGEDELAYAETSAANSWSSNQEYFEKHGIAESSVRLMVQNDLKRQRIFDDLYEAGGEKEVSTGELETMYAERYAKADVVSFSPLSGENPEEQREKAEEFVRRAQDGEDFYELIYELDKEQAEQSEDGDKDAVEKPAPGSYTNIFGEHMRGYVGDGLIDGVFEVPVGETVLVEDGSYLYVVSRLDILEDKDEFEQYRDSLLAELKEEEFQEQVTQWADAVSPEANQAALQKYTPAKLKLE